MKTNYSTKKLEEILEKIPKIVGMLTKDYLDQGTFPIVDQGQSFIAGYTNSRANVYGGALPVIVFGDHTRAIKFVDFPFAIGADGTKILKPTSEFDAKFFYYFLLSISIPARGYARHYSLLREFQIPIPTVVEQKRIVAKTEKQFAKIDEVALLRAESEALAAQILPAALHEIFSSAESKGWAIETIGDIATLKSGVTIPKELELESGDVPYLKVGDMNMRGNEKFANASSRYVTRTPKIERMIISPNSVIFPKRGGAIATNKKRIVQQDILIDLNTMAVICPAESLDADFFYYWFLQIDLATLNTGSSVPQINNGQIAPLKIPLPPIAEQKKIAKKLDALSEKVRALQALQSAQAADLKALKQSILHDAFSGTM